MAEKFDKLVKICEEVCKKEFAEYEKKYMAFVESYTKAIALTATYSGVSNGKSWPKDFYKDSPNPATYGDLFKWMFVKEYGSKYYDEKDVVDEDESVYLDAITGKEYKTRVEVVGRVSRAPEKEGDQGLPDDIVEASMAGNEEITQIYKSLKKNYRDTQNYLSYKKILQEITPSVYSEKVVNQYLERLTPEGIRTWTPEKFSEIWRDGLQGKSSMHSDVGIADFVAREYPLYQEVYGGNFWVVIDNPWSKRENPEGPQALADAIREKSTDPAANNPKGTTASEASAGASASDVSAAGPSASTPLKYKPFVEGLIDGFQIEAKTDLPDFRIFVSDPDTWKALDGAAEEGEDSFSNVDGAEEDDEYSETAFQGSDEEQIKLDLTTFLSQGDSEGGADDDTAGGAGGAGGGPSGGDVQTGGGVNTNSSKSAGGSGDRRFQKQMTINGRVVKNGELPDDLLAKLDFCGFKVEKNAARRLNELNAAFKANFGKNIALSGGFRTFKTQNDIFDWDYYDKYKKGRKKGTNGGVAAATPGGSKHGWGQAIDCSGFGNGPGNKYFDWMEANAKKYGWVNPAWAKKSGAGYEPWHWEYIGSDLFK
jgi:hypothetical protein